MSTTTSNDLLTQAKKNKATTVVDGYTYFNLTPPLDLDKTYPLFEERGFNLIVQTMHDGIDSKSANIDKSQYMAIHQVMYAFTQSNAEDMYHKVKQTMETYVSEQVLPALQSLTGVRLLHAFRARWHNHVFMSCWMSRFFSSMDKPLQSMFSNKAYVCTASMTLRTFFSHGYTRLSSGFLNHPVVNALLEEITKFRNTQEADMTLIADTVGIIQHLGAISTTNHIKLVVADNKEFKSGTWKSAPALLKYTDLSIYRNDFETLLIRRTGDYYRKKSLVWISMDTVR